MGVRSTHTILRVVAQQVLTTRVFTMTDEQLADALEHLDESEFRNYDVVHSEERLREAAFSISSLEEFRYPKRNDDV